VIADDAGFATLAAFQASELFSFAMKLLVLPAHATRVLSGLRVILLIVVANFTHEGVFILLNSSLSLLVAMDFR